MSDKYQRKQIIVNPSHAQLDLIKIINHEIIAITLHSWFYLTQYTCQNLYNGKSLKGFSFQVPRCTNCRYTYGINAWYLYIIVWGNCGKIFILACMG